MKMTVKKLSAGTVYKLVGTGLLFSLVPFSVLMGLLSVFGAETVKWNEQPITGVQGLIASPFLGLFLVAIFTALIGTAIALGLWVYSWFRPITITYPDDD